MRSQVATFGAGTGPKANHVRLDSEDCFILWSCEADQQLLPMFDPQQRRARLGLRAQRSMVRPLFWSLTLALLGTSHWLSGTRALPPLTEPGLVGSISSTDGYAADPLHFSPQDLRALQQRFGVHGPQPRVAQLFTAGLDQLEPLRSRTLSQLEELRPIVVRESRRQGVNPMLVLAVLFDELQHAKPGESHPIAAHSGLFSTLGPAQLGLGEMVHQGLLPADASPDELQQARSKLLDPAFNVSLLVGKFARLSGELGHPRRAQPPMASRTPREAKQLAVLAYLHNGKFDYPRRVLRYMQDPELHALLFGQRQRTTTPLI